LKLLDLQGGKKIDFAQVTQVVADAFGLSKKLNTTEYKHKWAF
jgi:hypothetical protein